MELNYEMTGEGDNLLVLIHPFPVNRNYFDKIKNNLLPSGWKLCLPNLPGFGSVPNDMDKEVWKMEDLAYLKTVIPNISINNPPRQYPDNLSGDYPKK